MRLLTIHAAKGLEFKVVIVADAGRDTAGAPSTDEILVALRRPLRLPGDRPDLGQAQGRLRLRGGARGREARGPRRAAAPLLRRDDARDRPADRLRRDRPRARAGPRDADRLGARAARRAAETSSARRRAGRARARRGAVRRSPSTRWAPPLPRATCPASPTTPASSRSSPSCRPRRRRAATGCPSSCRPDARRCTACGRLSYSALALFERCSYRYYAERVAGLREERGTVPGATRPDGDRDRRRRAPAARARRPRGAGVARRRASCATWYPAVTDEELERIAAFVDAYCELGARARASRRSRACSPSGRSRSSTTACSCTGGSTCSGARAAARSSLDYKTNSLAEGTPEEIVEADYTLQRLVYALACFRAGADEVEVVYHFLERPDAVVSTTFERRELPLLESGAVGGDRAHQRRRVRPDAERVHVLRLPGARSRLRRAAARRRCVAARGARRAPGLMARSYVREARKRVAPKKDRIRPVIERLAVEHADAKIALTFREPARAARLGDALGADDRREREPRHGEALRQVPPARGLPRGAAGGARAGHLRDRLLPAEGEVAARDDDDADRGVRRRGAGGVRRAAAAARRGAEDGERRLGRARATRRESSSTRTCAGSRSGSASRSRRTR